MQRVALSLTLGAAALLLFAAGQLATGPWGLLHPLGLGLVLCLTGAYAVAVHSLDELRSLPQAPIQLDPRAVGSRLLALAKRAKIDGRRGLEAELPFATSPLERHGLLLLADGSSRAELDLALHARRDELHCARQTPERVWRDLARGVVNSGVLVTLAGMTAALVTRPDAPGAAELGGALTATLYGLVLALFICLPAAAARRRAEQEALRVDGLWLDGLLAIADGVHPLRLADRLDGRLGDRRPVRAA